MFDLIAPVTAPQAFTPALCGVQHPLAPKVMDAIRQRGPSPVGLWKIINALAKAENPDCRSQRWCWQLRFWGAVRELGKAKLLFRHGALIATRDFAYKPKARTVKRVSPSVATKVCQTAGSNGLMVATAMSMEKSQLLKNKLFSSNGGVVAAPPQSENAAPSEARISAAASLLAMRPRPRKRKWTGVLHGERVRRGTLVRVPSGHVLPADFVRRGKVYVLFPKDSDKIIDRFDVREVVRIKNPAAVLLGRLKRGVRERQSEAKAATARRNGLCPCRPGKARGRPRVSKRMTMPSTPH